MFGFPRNVVCSDGVCCCITIVCYTEFIVSSDTCLEFIEKTNRKFIEREKIKTMLKLIFKNLWARRRRNGWLLAELILVSIVTWIILDPVIVVTHDRSIPLGYDADRLCLISLSKLQPQAPAIMKRRKILP